MIIPPWESGDTHCNIDLIQQIECGHYEFLELKCDSSKPPYKRNANNPLFAAREILGYGLIYLLSREYRTTLGYAANLDLLRAEQIELKVLAPLSFYSDHGRRDELYRLQEKMQAGLQALLVARCVKQGLSMSFSFEAFPDECRWETAEEVQDLLRRRHPLCGASLGAS